MAASVLALAVGVFVVGSAQMRRHEMDRQLTVVRGALADAGAAHDKLQTGTLSSRDAAAQADSERKAASDAQRHADQAVALDGGDRDALAARDRARASVAQAGADAEAAAAMGIVQDVTDSIERYKNRVLSEQEAASIRDELKRKLADAQTRCDKAIGLDGKNLVAWIQRVRALRLAADTDGARTAVEQALALFPDNAELRRLQNLINSAQ